VHLFAAIKKLVSFICSRIVVIRMAAEVENNYLSFSTRNKKNYKIVQRVEIQQADSCSESHALPRAKTAKSGIEQNRFASSSAVSESRATS
jgi:hypothetical protein